MKQKFQLKCLRRKKGIVPSGLCSKVAVMVFCKWFGLVLEETELLLKLLSKICLYQLHSSIVSTYWSRANSSWDSRKFLFCLLLLPALVCIPKRSLNLKQALLAGFLVSSLSQQSYCLLLILHEGDEQISPWTFCDSISSLETVFGCIFIESCLHLWCTLCILAPCRAPDWSMLELSTFSAPLIAVIDTTTPHTYHTYPEGS